MVVPWVIQVQILAGFSTLGFVLSSIPLFWHLQSWNVGSILYVFWTGGQCLVNAIHMIVWRNNAINWAPVWCDIATRFFIASGIGTCCSSLVINRRLYHIANMSLATLSSENKRRQLIIDLLIGLGIPILAVALYWFYQGHRFNILEGIGCIETFPNTFLAYMLYMCWPLPIGLVSASYAILTLRALGRRRKQINEVIAKNKGPTFDQYIRLMGLAGVEVMCTTPLAIYVIVSNLRLGGWYEFHGLAELHFGFSRVDSMSAIFWRSYPMLVSIMLYRMLIPSVCAVVFFAFFGLTTEAFRNYKRAIAFVATSLGISSDSNFAGRRAVIIGSGDPDRTISFVKPPEPPRMSMTGFSDGSLVTISYGEAGEHLRHSTSGGSSSSIIHITEARRAQEDRDNALPTSIVTPIPHDILPRMPQRAYSLARHRHHSADPRPFVLLRSADMVWFCPIDTVTTLRS